MIEIRECREDDFDEILGLLVQLWPERQLDEARLRETYRRGLGAEGQVYVCATAESILVGFGSLSIRNSLWQQGYLGHVDELVVEKKYRGQGIGTALLAHMVKAAEQTGCLRVELDSAFHREEAHRFYEANGFSRRALLFTKEVQGP